jgi:hypothetical protein
LWRWFTATLYTPPRLPLIHKFVATVLILVAAGLVTWAVESSLRYLVRHLSPPAAHPSTEGGEMSALRMLQSSTGQQDLPALLGELCATLRAAAGADSALFSRMVTGW